MLYVFACIQGEDTDTSSMYAPCVLTAKEQKESTYAVYDMVLRVSISINLVIWDYRIRHIVVLLTIREDSAHLQSQSTSVFSRRDDRWGATSGRWIPIPPADLGPSHFLGFLASTTYNLLHWITSATTLYMPPYVRLSRLDGSSNVLSEPALFPLDPISRWYMLLQARLHTGRLGGTQIPTEVPIASAFALKYSVPRDIMTNL